MEKRSSPLESGREELSNEPKIADDYYVGCGDEQGCLDRRFSPKRVYETRVRPISKVVQKPPTKRMKKTVWKKTRYSWR